MKPRFKNRHSKLAFCYHTAIIHNASPIYIYTFNCLKCLFVEAVPDFIFGSRASGKISLDRTCLHSLLFPLGGRGVCKNLIAPTLRV